MLYLKELRWATVSELMEMHQRKIPFAGWGIKGHNRPFILHYCQFKPSMKVVEIGGAYSDLPQYIAKNFGCQVDVIDDFGVESGEASLWSRWGAREEVQKRNPDVRYIFDRVGNLHSNKIPLNYYDLIYTVSTLEHVPAHAMAKVFLHMEQMLKPDGLMVHCIDLQIPLKLHKTKTIKGLLLGTAGYYLYFWAMNHLAPASRPQLKTLIGWKQFLKKTFGSGIDVSPVRPEGALMSSLNPDIVTEPAEIVYKYYPPAEQPKLFRRNGSFILVIEKRAQASK
ncbi:MAG: class I SAM-dependent methyltransferase [Cytophagales bacterium]|nr:class I SAM-dependent methyltransferase [Bernardetiaceae bacterium]MDW8209470.1 class I SAM-dependent methyltransferase [Cytophagales bacterium]